MTDLVTEGKEGKVVSIHSSDSIGIPVFEATSRPLPCWIWCYFLGSFFFNWLWSKQSLHICTIPTAIKACLPRPHQSYYRWGGRANWNIFAVSGPLQHLFSLLVHVVLFLVMSLARTQATSDSLQKPLISKCNVMGAQIGAQAFFSRFPKAPTRVWVLLISSLFILPKGLVRWCRICEENLPIFILGGFLWELLYKIFKSEGISN